jgi:hypothetical protein
MSGSEEMEGKLFPNKLLDINEDPAYTTVLFKCIGR